MMNFVFENRKKTLPAKLLVIFWPLDDGPLLMASHTECGRHVQFVNRGVLLKTLETSPSDPGFPTSNNEQGFSSGLPRYK